MTLIRVTVICDAKAIRAVMLQLKEMADATVDIYVEEAESAEVVSDGNTVTITPVDHSAFELDGRSKL